MATEFTYKIGGELDLDEVIDLYVASTLGKRRPVHDRSRMQKMIECANLIVTAWDGSKLVGIGRSFTDYSCVTYMHCLAVRSSHQRHGIGREIIKCTQVQGGPHATLVLTAAPEAERYYPHVGFVNVPQCWILPAEDKLDYYRSIGVTARSQWLL
jgi:GNAT superfamily N-acetyltransferase